MARTFYSDYVNHCLRYYVRHPKSELKTGVDVRDWMACDKVIKNLTKLEREIVFHVYLRNDPISNCVEDISILKNVQIQTTWKIIRTLERNVAIERGLYNGEL